MIHMRTVTLTIGPTRSRILHTNLQFIEEVKLVSVKTASTTTVVPTFEAACYYFGIVSSPPPPPSQPLPNSLTSQPILFSWIQLKAAACARRRWLSSGRLYVRHVHK